MVSKIFPVVASDEYAEKELSPNTLHLGPSPRIISKRQLQVSSTIVKYTWHDKEIYSKKDINYSHSHHLSRPTNYYA